MDYAKPFAKVGKATFTVTLKDTEYSKTFEVSVKAADKTALNNAIAAAEKLTEDKYESGWDAFQAAFDAAKKVAADEDATPAQVADALAALQAARKALVKVDGEKPGPQDVFCQVVIGQCGVSFPSEKAVGFSPVRNWPVIARVLLFHCIRA